MAVQSTHSSYYSHLKIITFFVQENFFSSYEFFWSEKEKKKKKKENKNGISARHFKEKTAHQQSTR